MYLDTTMLILIMQTHHILISFSLYLLKIKVWTLICLAWLIVYGLNILFCSRWTSIHSIFQSLDIRDIYLCVLIHYHNVSLWVLLFCVHIFSTDIVFVLMIFRHVSKRHFVDWIIERVASLSLNCVHLPASCIASLLTQILGIGWNCHGSRRLSCAVIIFEFERLLFIVDLKYFSSHLATCLGTLKVVFVLVDLIGISLNLPHHIWIAVSSVPCFLPRGAMDVREQIIQSTLLLQQWLLLLWVRHKSALIIVGSVDKQNVVSFLFRGRMFGFFDLRTFLPGGHSQGWILFGA